MNSNLIIIGNYLAKYMLQGALHISILKFQKPDLLHLVHVLNKIHNQVY
ncbi:hypothetical protein SAMN03003324_03020 [Pedobacter antarcticus]|uniref:Uncharacterized protein n=1 Tax=Pedobacter antarcticus TaxID=34086 RepID=A0A1I2H7I6_9SPHI|nr:hypothetical protein SAMN03003324_03020 [Pedobacter antarcticus]